MNKETIKTKAEFKTYSDYSLILEYINGYNKQESRELSMKSETEPLFQELLKRNIELFTTGTIIMQ